MVPVFILSAPRSGTTWLVRALTAHPELHATELRAFGEHVDVVYDAGAAKPRLRITLDAYVDALLQPHAWEPLGPSRARVADDLLREVYETIAAHARRRTGKPRLVDKVTPYRDTADLVIQSIVRLFPTAKIILLLRDGRDVAVSGVMHWLTKSTGEVSDHQRQRRSALLEGARTPLPRFFSDDELDAWASHWRQPIDALRRWGPMLDQMVVRYEAMSADLHAELERICRFIGVSTSPDVISRSVDASSFERMSGGRRRGEDAPGAHVRKGVVGDWTRYFTAADAERFHRISGDVLTAWGYEPDASWIATRPTVLP